MKIINIRVIFLVFIILLGTSVNNISAQKDQPIIKFGLIADIQYADCDPEGSRFYRNSLKKVRDCINYFNEQGVSFTINLGDIVDRNFSDLDSIIGYLSLLKNRVYNITGNHDYKGISDDKKLYKKLGMPSEYYSFEIKGCVFIMLNTNEISTYSNIVKAEKESELSAMLNCIKLEGRPQGASWNGGISKKQLEWLNKLLSKAEKARKDVLIFSHHPLYPETEFAALNYREILDIVDNYSCVRAIFSGHHHSGNFAYYKNIPVITVEGMIETESENAYGIVEIYRNEIMVKGYGRMTSRVFKKNSIKSD
ncbi:metallophosphoesterase [Dysgonomonas sp.]